MADLAHNTVVIVGVGREGQALKWVRANDLRNWPMPPADLPLIPVLRDLL